MASDPPAASSAPFGTLLLLAIACGFYVAMLTHAGPPHGDEVGDAVVGEAFAIVILTGALWLTLALLLLVGGGLGRMPRWVAVLAIFLHPLAGAAVLVAIDMCSRSLGWAIVFPVLLPALIALWARWPRLHRALPATSTSATAWGAIGVLSILPLGLAYYY